ncbi:MAG: YegP family protein [Candidatus Methanomethylophilaceae archaeon]|nr:YegP family protein [Candidatus Methanomethylophilaceae archaeon]
MYLDKAGEYRFRLLASNGENLLASEGYTSKANAKNGIESVKKNCDSEIEVKEE